jgi:hypothetical protein
MRRLTGPALGAAIVLLAGISTHAVAEQTRTAIPFADLGNIHDWHADSADELYIEAANRKWYRTTFWSPCNPLPFASTIAFVTEPTGELDKYSSILVEGERCWFKTFEQTTAPVGADRDRAR